MKQGSPVGEDDFQPLHVDVAHDSSLTTSRRISRPGFRSPAGVGLHRPRRQLVVGR